MSRECNLIADQPGEENNATRTGPVRLDNCAHDPRPHKGMPDGGEGGGDAVPREGAGHHDGDLGGESEVRFNVRHKNERDINIREITLPDVFLYHLASTSEVNPDSQPVVMVIAARNSKTSKDARLQQKLRCATPGSGAVRRRRDRPVAATSSSTRSMWRTNKVFCKRNVHAARAGGAQELAIGGTPRAQIAELGHWALDKMTRAYITAIPVGVVMQKAGYSGLKQDYFLGRSRVEPCDQLLDLLAKHIFPGVDAILRDAETRAVNESDANAAAVHFLRTLVMFQRIVAEDLAVKLVRTPWHPYVKEISVRMDTQYHNMSLKEALKKEVERSALEKLGYQETIEKQNETIASLTAELARLTEALRVSEARRMPAAPPSATDQTPGEGGSADSANTGTGAKRDDGKPPPPPQTAEEASYELNVVQPWRDSKTVRDAWRLWNSATANDTRRLCDRVAEPGFIDRHTLLKGATQGALNMRVRRMLKAMDATAPTMSKEPGMGVKGLGPKVVSKLRLACALVALELKPTTWVDRLFPDT
ncbi:unnamed protein product [Closterium sp. NIES-64]|nr:unnamed protein product [Closterium sp. NIES-64]